MLCVDVVKMGQFIILSFQTHMTFFLQQNTKGTFLNTALQENKGGYQIHFGLFLLYGFRRLVCSVEYSIKTTFVILLWWFF